MTENNMIEEIRKMNLKLHEEFATSNNYSDEEYTPTMLKFLNNMDEDCVVKFIYDINDFNKYLVNKEDLEKAIEFYDKVDGKIDECLFVMFGGYIRFVEHGGFYRFCEKIIKIMEYEETIIFNKYIMNKLYPTNEYNHTLLKNDDIYGSIEEVIL